MTDDSPGPGAALAALRLPLRTSDLVLRRWRAEDLPAIVAIRDGDPQVIRFTPVEQPFTLELAREHVAKWDARRRDGIGVALAVTEAATGAVVGEIELYIRSWPNRTAELAYATAAAARGRGLTTQALIALRDAAVTAGFRRLVLQVEPGNVGSWRVATRAGFQLEGIQRAVSIDRGRPVDLAILAHVASPPTQTIPATQ